MPVSSNRAYGPRVRLSSW